MSTLPPADLNREIANLVGELRSPQDRDNSPLDPSLVTGLDPAKLEVMQVAVQLSPEQLAASGATVRRLDIEAKIDSFIQSSQKLFEAITKEDLPDYLRRSGTDEEYINRFFANIDSIPAEAMTYVAQIEGANVATAKTWQAEWQTAKAEETLDAESKQLVRAALDLRMLLIGALRYLGYTGSEISAIAG